MTLEDIYSSTRWIFTLLKNAIYNLDTYQFVPPAYVQSLSYHAYFRIHYTSDDRVVFSLRTSVERFSIIMYLGENYIRIQKDNTDEYLYLSTEACTESDMFQLRLMYNYGDIEFQDLVLCNNLYRLLVDKFDLMDLQYGY